MLLVAQHGVEDGEELAHAGGESDFLQFASLQHLLVLSLDHRVVACGNEGRHIENTADLPTPGALLRISRCSCQAFCSFRNCWIWSSRCFFSSFKMAIIRSTELRRLGEMVRKRFCSAFSISSTCLRLTSRALNCFSASLLPV